MDVKKIVGKFYENELQKANQNEFRVEKVIKRKGDKRYVKWKGCGGSFESWIDKKEIIKISEYFPKPKSLGRIVKVKLDLSNYPAIADL